MAALSSWKLFLTSHSVNLQTCQCTRESFQTTKKRRNFCVKLSKYLFFLLTPPYLHARVANLLILLDGRSKSRISCIFDRQFDRQLLRIFKTTSTKLGRFVFYLGLKVFRGLWVGLGPTCPGFGFEKCLLLTYLT